MRHFARIMTGLAAACVALVMVTSCEEKEDLTARTVEKTEPATSEWVIVLGASTKAFHVQSADLSLYVKDEIVIGKFPYESREGGENDVQVIIAAKQGLLGSASKDLWSVNDERFLSAWREELLGKWGVSENANGLIRIGIPAKEVGGAVPGFHPQWFIGRAGEIYFVDRADTEDAEFILCESVESGGHLCGLTVVRNGLYFTTRFPRAALLRWRGIYQDMASVAEHLRFTDVDAQPYKLALNGEDYEIPAACFAGIGFGSKAAIEFLELLVTDKALLMPDGAHLACGGRDVEATQVRVKMYPKTSISYRPYSEKGTDLKCQEYRSGKCRIVGIHEAKSAVIIDFPDVPEQSPEEIWVNFEMFLEGLEAR